MEKGTTLKTNANSCCVGSTRICLTALIAGYSIWSVITLTSRAAAFFAVQSGREKIRDRNANQISGGSSACFSGNTHFLEIAKLVDLEISRDPRDPVVEWMEFLDAKSKGVIEMLAEKNQDIKKAYDLLQIISKDEKARMLYEAREAELRDQLTRLKIAEDKGREEGRAEGMSMGEFQKALKIAEKMLRRGDSVEEISELTELLPEKVAELKNI